MIEPLLRIVHWLIQDLTEAWCIAKIRGPVGPIEPPVGSRYEEEFALAEYLETSTFRHQDDFSERQFITVATLRQELEKISAPEVSAELLDLIEFFACLGSYQETNSSGGATTSLSLQRLTTGKVSKMEQ